MTDRQEQFDLKISKLKILWKQRHLHLGCPWGKQKHIKNSFQSELYLVFVSALCVQSALWLTFIHFFTKCLIQLTSPLKIL